MQEECLAADHQPTLMDILKSVKSIHLLRPQERRVVLREVIASCDEEDIQVLQRLLGQTTRSGYDLMSSFPVEISHNIFSRLDGGDLIRCCAVCWPWRRLIRGDSSLWKAKILTLNPAECFLLKDLGTSIHTPVQALRDTVADSRESMLDRIAQQPGFIGWEAALVRELALKHNWRRGRYMYEMTVKLQKSIKPTLLAWPYLFMADDSSKLYKISLAVDQILSVTLDGLITFFQKGEEYRPIRSCNVTTKVLQVTPVSFGVQTFTREHEGSAIIWKEAICLAHEDGVIIKDEHSHTLCHVYLELGCKLLQFQAIADHDYNNNNNNNTHAGDDSDHMPTGPHYRNELLILFEDPKTRQRRVLCVKMEAGYLAEISREVLTHSGEFSLGRGGDARDSIAMYRDRIAVVSHRHCSSDLGHYCVLRLIDVKEDVAVSTEYAKDDSEESEEDEEEQRHEREVDSHGDQDLEEDIELDQEDAMKYNRIPAMRIQQRRRDIHLHDFAGGKTAYRILAMDHARIVLGVGLKFVKILCLI
ncbi:hypothetical protein BGZ65_002575 [Modicella reniformis]|uniref:F-box domain-containing protein n=1 Tax=Modicella reniformis TaxID=1440133 RepID=A0A9P6MJ35_9FUNG|nr:hypothetical protein BGZ65_002575 [Modicella reniformis]